MLVASYGSRQEADLDAQRRNQQIVARHGKWTVAPLFYVEDSLSQEEP